jgi:hypothetical protein
VSTFGEQKTLLAPFAQNPAQCRLAVQIAFRGIDDVQAGIQGHAYQRIRNRRSQVADLSGAQTQPGYFHSGLPERPRFQRLAGNGDRVGQHWRASAPL